MSSLLPHVPWERIQVSLFFANVLSPALLFRILIFSILLLPIVTSFCWHGDRHHRWLETSIVQKLKELSFFLLHFNIFIFLQIFSFSRMQPLSISYNITPYLYSSVQKKSQILHFFSNRLKILLISKLVMVSHIGVWVFMLIIEDLTVTVGVRGLWCLQWLWVLEQQ